MMVKLSEADVACKVLESAGIPYVVDRRGKHNKVRWEVDGRKFAYSCAKSPGDWRASENCRCAVRRILRAAGVDI